MTSVAARSDYGWVILIGAFLVQMLAIGATSFGFGLFVKPIAEEFGIPRGSVNLGLILLIVGMAIASPSIGRAYDRLPARYVMLAGAALFGAGALAIAFSTDIRLIAAATFFLLAPGTAALGPIMASAQVARWFDRRRGRALGIVAISSSAGGFLVVPLIAYLIEGGGWRNAMALAGAGIAAITALIALFAIRDQSLTIAAAGAEPANDPRWTTKQLLRTRDFWLMVLSIGGLLGIAQALLSALVAYGTDRGFALAQASGLVMAVSLSAIVGKVLIGVLADTVDKRFLLAAVAVMMELFLFILYVEPTYPMLLIGCLFAGVAIGGATPIWAALISSRFGVTSYGLVMGLCVPMQMPLVLLAVRYVGDSFDRSGSYGNAFLLFAALTPVTALAALALGRPNFRKL